MNKNIKLLKLVDFPYAQSSAFISASGGAIRQSPHAGELRDRLLPKLMSGEIRVMEADKMLEDTL